MMSRIKPLKYTVNNRVFPLASLQQGVKLELSEIDFEETLIKQVRSFPCVWQTKNKGLKRI